MTLLHTLPREHRLRTLPLGDIGAEYLGGHPPTWRKVRTPEKEFRIARNCYNDLGPAWTENTQWRAAE